ncbi:hypothetical protein Tco_1365295, partial [Tanacetum coccineum]
NDHIARPYTQSKKIQCLKQQMLLTQLQEAGIQLSKDQLAILADTGERINFGPGAFIVTTNALFQADGVEVYDSDCDDVPNAQPSFMANISSYGSDALAEVYNPDNVDNNIINQAVQNSNSSAQQDALILSMIEQLKIQVINCTKINLDNKSVNDSLTVEFERYKEQVKVLKEGQNVDLKSKDNVSDSCKQSVEIDRLKQTLSEHLKEKESLMQTVTLLKNDFKKEEIRNIDREIALEKKIKQLDNIVYKRDQSAQTVHMLTKPQFFYDHTTNAIVIPNSKETLMLAEESHSKMLLNQQDPMVLEKKVNTTPVDYAVLNQLAQDFEKQFVPQTELSTEQAFWSQNSMNSSDANPYCRPTKVEVLKELPKVSMVDLEPLSPKFKKNREAYVDYIRITKENTNTLHDIVEQARTSNPLDNALAYACMYTKQIQELLVYVSDTCPSSPLKSEKLVAVTPMNKARKVTFAKTSTTSDNNTQIHVDVYKTQTTNKPSVPSTNVNCSTNASRSKPCSETKNNRIMQPLSSN